MKKSGFTLIELLAVIVILGIVIAIAIPGINIVINNSRQKAVLSEANLLHSASIRKLGENPEFDFSLVNKDNLKEYLEVDGSKYDDVFISNNDGLITVLLKKYGFRTSTNGKENTITNLQPHIALEYDLSLGQGFVNIREEDLLSGDVYVYSGTYESNRNNIKKGFKNPLYVWTDLKPTDNLRNKLNTTTGIYTIISTKMKRTVSYETTGGIISDDFKNIALINVPNFDILELETNSLEYIFAGAANFNQNINHWDTRNITSFNHMFDSASTFNQPLNNWNTSNVKIMNMMFIHAYSFNQPVDKWDVSKVLHMQSMFHTAKKFNQPLNNWNMSGVKNAPYMFYIATSFNQDLNNWNTSNISNMDGMFYFASDFNGDVSSWNTSSVTTMKNMFRGAETFSKDLSGWNVLKVEDYSNFSLSSGLLPDQLPNFN